MFTRAVVECVALRDDVFVVCCAVMARCVCGALRVVQLRVALLMRVEVAFLLVLRVALSALCSRINAQRTTHNAQQQRNAPQQRNTRQKRQQHATCNTTSTRNSLNSSAREHAQHATQHQRVTLSTTARVNMQLSTARVNATSRRNNNAPRATHATPIQDN